MHLEMTLQMHWPFWLERSLWIFGGALIGAGLLLPFRRLDAALLGVVIGGLAQFLWIALNHM
jgi:hypothetical protein